MSEERWPHLSPEEREVMMTAPSFERVNYLPEKGTEPEPVPWRERFVLWLLRQFERP